MKKSINSMIVFALLFGFCATHHAKNNVNELLELFHHRGAATPHNPWLIELDKIVFYFSDKADIQRISDPNNNHELVFFAPQTHLGTKIFQQQQWTKKEKKYALATDHFSLEVQEVNEPIHGIKFLVRINPSLIAFEYDIFESIQLQKGLVFKFYNKTALELMAKKEKAVLQLTSLDKPSIIIDCGHGGTDTGAIGCFNIKEKDITMAVGLKVASLLKKKGFTVYLTRDHDILTPLDARTSFANYCPQACMLISLHANFSKKPSASGIETFCLDSSLFKPWFSTLTETGRECTALVSHDLQKKSNLLAQAIHHNVLTEAKKQHEGVLDRKVKYSATQVLMGAQMPSALIELGFLSNEHEARMLNDSGYQQLLAHGICKGILACLART